MFYLQMANNESLGLDDTLGSIVKMIVALIVIIGMIVLLARFLSNKNRAWHSNRPMKVLAGISLGQNKSVQLLELGDAVYVLGVGDDIQLIDKISGERKQELIDLIRRTSAAGNRPRWAIDFRTWLGKKGTGKTSVAADKPADEPFHRILHDTLHRISSKRHQQWETWPELEETEDKHKP